MSGVTFNRNRVKLKKLLGIRARLAMLALMLVAPLMLERVRSLEDTRARQIALASEEYANLAQHSAETQREVISSVETMLKSAAYIRASGGVGRSCEILRASLPANLPWIRSMMIVGEEGVVQCSTIEHAGRPRPQRPGLFQEGAAKPAISFSATSCSARPPTRPIMMAAYPVSAINPDEDSVVLAGINLDWMSKIMTNLGGRPGISSRAGRQHRHRAGGARRPGQHDRPAAGHRAAAVGHRLQGARFQLPIRARFPSPPPTAPSAPSVSRAFPARNRA